MLQHWYSHKSLQSPRKIFCVIQWKCAASWWFFFIPGQQTSQYSYVLKKTVQSYGNISIFCCIFEGSEAGPNPKFNLSKISTNRSTLVLGKQAQRYPHGIIYHQLPSATNQNVHSNTKTGVKCWPEKPGWQQRTSRVGGFKVKDGTAAGCEEKQMTVR